eukprot:SAG25_NODE_7438_length_480_cov_1.493438_1_plen_45_part_10
MCGQGGDGGCGGGLFYAGAVRGLMVCAHRLLAGKRCGCVWQRHQS